MWPFKYPYTNFHELNLDWILENVEKNRNSIITLENTVNNLNPDEPIGNPGILHVGHETGMYNTINDAISFAKQYCRPENRVLILIHGGEYNESIRLAPNPGIDMIGLADTTIKCPNAIQYPDAALYTVGSGFFENITFETSGGGAYALHYEVQGYETDVQNSQCVFHNCKFIGHNGKGGAGCGGGSNDTLKFINCKITSEGGNGGYFHNHPTAEGTKFTLECDSCNISGGNSVTIEFYPASVLNMGFKNNTLAGKTQFRNMNNDYYTGYVVASSNLNNYSIGNNGRALENESTMITSFPAIEFSQYFRVSLPVSGIINKESIKFEKYLDNPAPSPSSLVISPNTYWVEIAYPASENPGLNKLTGYFYIRPQIV